MKEQKQKWVLWINIIITVLIFLLIFMTSGSYIMEASRDINGGYDYAALWVLALPVLLVITNLPSIVNLILGMVNIWKKNRVITIIMLAFSIVSTIDLMVFDLISRFSGIMLVLFIILLISIPVLLIINLIYCKKD